MLTLNQQNQWASYRILLKGLTPVEDLGGPTPENYSPTNDSAKLKTPGGTLKQVKDVVNKNAVKAEEVETEGDVVAEKYAESPEERRDGYEEG
jgi:hypothetical protein